MIIHVVTPGDTLFSIAARYGAPENLLRLANQLPPDGRLVVGQALVVQVPQQVHTVAPGDTLSSIARRYGVTQNALLRRNIWLRGGSTLFPGQVVVISYWDEQKRRTLQVSGYAYPFIDEGLLRQTLPYLSILIPFTYGFTMEGRLVQPADEALVAAALEYGVAPYLHLSTLTEAGGFSNALSTAAFQSAALQQQLISSVIDTMQQKGYQGLDVDFEFLLPQEAELYVDFLERLQQQLKPLGYPLITALAPKTSATQPGLLYEGHDYAGVGAVSDQVLLMTYEWGYTYSAPMAVAPLPSVRRVVEYAVTAIPAEKILLGIPNYGYDWNIPHVPGTRARSLSSQEAVALARRYGAEILYDTQAQTPYFRYTDDGGQGHEVWFEDARSIVAKLDLADAYSLPGVGYWNLMRDFPQNWLVLEALYDIAQNP